LFFGDRDMKNDYLYRDELQQWETDGKVKVSFAWSRTDGIPKTYVQDSMRQNGSDVFNVLQQGGYFFVCGDATYMAKDVESALLEIIATHGAMSVDKAQNYLDDMKKSKRYVRDVY
jgi:sulfite reductase (NADPH) flavoprotein alpha-component